MLSWSLSSWFIHCLWCDEQTSKGPRWWSHLPCLLCPGVRPLCPHYFVWVSGSSRHATPQSKYFFFFLCFVSITGPPDLTQSSTVQQVQIRGPWALGHFTLKDQLEHLLCIGHSHDGSPTVSVSPADGTFINTTNSAVFVLARHTQSKNSFEVFVFRGTIRLHLASLSFVQTFCYLLIWSGCFYLEPLVSNTDLERILLLPPLITRLSCSATFACATEKSKPPSVSKMERR